MSQFLVALSVVVATIDRCHSIGPQHPRYEALRRCRDEERWTWVKGGPEADESMSRCFKELLITASHEFKRGNGLPDLGILAVDPLVVPFINLDLPQFNMKGNVTDLTLRGVSRAFDESTMEVNMSASSRRGQVVLHSPTRFGTLKFNVTANFLGAIFPGASLRDQGNSQGKVQGVFGEKNITLYFKFREVTDPRTEGRSMLQVDSVGVSQTDSKFVKIHFFPTYSGTESPAERKRIIALFALMNSFAKNPILAHKGLVQQLEPETMSSIAEIIFHLFLVGFDNIHSL